jgi:hypothetical protein
VEDPYRAAPPIDTRLLKASHEARRSGWISFALLMALPFLSFGGCVATCSATEGKKPWTEVGPVGGTIVIVIGLGLLCTTFGFFLVAGRRSLWQRRSDAVGLALSILLGPASVIASAFWWFLDSSGLGGFGGGWGRPLRVGGRALSPDLAGDAAFPKGPRPDLDALTAEERALLGEMWSHDTKKEWASVPAFAQVAWHLSAGGAPPALVHRALESAQQEIDHARRCAALASTFLGEELGPMPMPELSRGFDALPSDRERALVRLAEDSLIDGAYVEDYNAELAAAALPETKDPAARATLERIVRDERMHAELGWDIVAYCIEQGGPTMREHLRQAWKRVPESAPAPYGDAIALRVAKIRAERLYDFGRVRPEHWVTVHAARRLVLEARLLHLLDATSDDRRKAA